MILLGNSKQFDQVTGLGKSKTLCQVIQFLKTGGMDCVAKPVDFALLDQMVMRMLGTNQ